jgi:hypothetical protein
MELYPQLGGVISQLTAVFRRKIFSLRWTLLQYIDSYIITSKNNCGSYQKISHKQKYVRVSSTNEMMMMMMTTMMMMMMMMIIIIIIIIIIRCFIIYVLTQQPQG